jgi:hypothetical protein
MTWAFQPVNDICVGCSLAIQPCAERNYIEWSPEHDNGLSAEGEPMPKGAYRRRCARCYDTLNQRPYNRRHSSEVFLLISKRLL